MLAVDAWSFGLNHLLTLFGFTITMTIAILGFRSFNKWKREKIEERRIDIALEALAFAYESGQIFASIRSPLSFDSEWSEMKGVDTPAQRLIAGPFFAVLSRIHAHKDYFDRAWKLQPRFMAVFGKDAAKIFDSIHQARTEIQVSAEMLLSDAINGGLGRDVELTKKLKADIWKGARKVPDEIDPKIEAFVNGVEALCLPVVAGRYAKPKK